MTLREELQAKLATARGEVADLEQKIAHAEQNFVQVLEADAEKVKDWLKSMAQHLGL